VPKPRSQADAQRAQDAVRNAEADRLTALKAAEEARREADAARAEQERLAKIAAEAVAAQKPTTIVASLPPGEEAPAAVEAATRKAEEEVLKATEQQKIASLPQGPKVELTEDPVRDPTALVRSLQAELKRIGCDPGAIGGHWSTKAKVALRDFNEAAKAMLSSNCLPRTPLRRCEQRRVESVHSPAVRTRRRRTVDAWQGPNQTRVAQR